MELETRQSKRISGQNRRTQIATREEEVENEKSGRQATAGSSEREKKKVGNPTTAEEVRRVDSSRTRAREKRRRKS